MKKLVRVFVAAALIVTGMYGISAAEDRDRGKPLIEVPICPEIMTVELSDQPVFEFHNPPIMALYTPPILVDRNIEKETIYKWYGSGGFGYEPGERGFKSRLMIMWNLVDYLDLDEDAAASFFPIFNDHTKKRDEFTKQHRELVTQIVNDIEDESVSISELKDLVQKLDDIDASISKERNTFLEKAKEILDDRQYVKLVIFNDKLKKDLFNRFSARRIQETGTGDPKLYGTFDVGDISRYGVEKKGLEEILKKLEEQQKKIEMRQKEIQKLLNKR